MIEFIDSYVGICSDLDSSMCTRSRIATNSDFHPQYQAAQKHLISNSRPKIRFTLISGRKRVTDRLIEVLKSEVLRPPWPPNSLGGQI